MKSKYFTLGKAFYSNLKLSISITDNYINIIEWTKGGNFNQEITIDRNEFDKFLNEYLKLQGDKKCIVD